MLKSILTLTARIAIFLSKNLARLTLVIAYYLFKVVGWLMRIAEQLAFRACVAAEIFKPIEFEGIKNPEFEQKFDEDAIEAMVDQLAGKAMTIQEIQSQFGISYRQARKVKQAADSYLPIHNYGKMAVA